MTQPSAILRLGTRGSLLALRQSQLVADQLTAIHPGLSVETIVITTTGDRMQGRSLVDEGGKGLFTREIDQALLAGEIDFAVHSLKDLPVTMPLVDQSNLILAAVPEREDPRDVLVFPSPNSALRTPHSALALLPQGAKVGTSSLRRRAQVLASRPDVVVEPIRGNIDTRLQKLRAGQYDAIILALAGLRRAGLFDAQTMHLMELDELLPAAGQGALALQCRRDDAKTIRLLSSMDDPYTHACVDLERSLVLALKGDCHSPIAAQVSMDEEFIEFRTAIAAREGTPPIIRAYGRFPRSDPQGALDAILQSLADQGVQDLLHPGR